VVNRIVYIFTWCLCVLWKGEGVRSKGVVWCYWGGACARGWWVLRLERISYSQLNLSLSWGCLFYLWFCFGMQQQGKNGSPTKSKVFELCRAYHPSPSSFTSPPSSPHLLVIPRHTLLSNCSLLYPTLSLSPFTFFFSSLPSFGLNPSFFLILANKNTCLYSSLQQPYVCSFVGL